MGWGGGGDNKNKRRTAVVPSISRPAGVKNRSLKFAKRRPLVYFLVVSRSLYQQHRRQGPACVASNYIKYVTSQPFRALFYFILFLFFSKERTKMAAP